MGVAERGHTRARFGRDRGDLQLLMALTRALHQRGRCPVAKTKARAAMPRLTSRTKRLRERFAQSVRPCALARYVIANVKHDGGPLIEGEPSKEGDHAVSLSRRDREPPACILERTPADPTGSVLDGVEHWQQQRPPGTGRVPAKRQVVVGRLARASLPQRRWLAQDAVDRRHLLGGRRPPRGPDIH